MILPQIIKRAKLFYASQDIRSHTNRSQIKNNPTKNIVNEVYSTTDLLVVKLWELQKMATTAKITVRPIKLRTYI